MDMLDVNFTDDGNTSQLLNLTDFYNDSSTCAARLLGSTEKTFSYPKNLAVISRIIIILYYVIIMLTGLLLNSTVFFLLCKLKQLRTLSFGMASQVLILDTAACIFMMVMGLINAGASDWVLGSIFCIISGFVNKTILLARTCIVLVLACDRFLLIFFAYTYTPKHRPKVMCALSILIWAFTLAVATTLLPGILDCYAFVHITWLCLPNSLCSHQCQIATNVYSLGTLLPASIFPIILFAALFWKADKLRHDNAPAVNNLGSGPNAPRREWRATVFFFLMFVAFFTVSFPQIVVTIVEISAYPGFEEPLWFHVTKIVVEHLFLILFVLDPLIVLLTMEVRVAWTEMVTQRRQNRILSLSEREKRRVNQRPKVPAKEGTQTPQTPNEDLTQGEGAATPIEGESRN